MQWLSKIYQSPSLISAIVWLGIILAMGLLFYGTEYFDRTLIILAGVAAAHLIVLISLERKE